MPRDVKGGFEPVIVKKHERSIGSKMEDVIISMFAHGMSNQGIESQMMTMYEVDVSPEIMSRITSYMKNLSLLSPEFIYTVKVISFDML